MFARKIPIAAPQVPTVLVILMGLIVWTTNVLPLSLPNQEYQQSIKHSFVLKVA